MPKGQNKNQIACTYSPKKSGADTTRPLPLPFSAVTQNLLLGPLPFQIMDALHAALFNTMYTSFHERALFNLCKTEI